MADDERTAKAIGRAFSFHPGTWSRPQRTGSWVLGPTFAVYAPEEKDYPQAPPARQVLLRSLIEQSGGQLVTEVGAKPHVINGTKRTCKSRYLTLDDSTRHECSFTLLALARAVGAKLFRVIEGERFPTVYGYDDDKVLVAILAGRELGENCGAEKVSAPKKVPGRPQKREGERPLGKV